KACPRARPEGGRRRKSLAARPPPTPGGVVLRLVHRVARVAILLPSRAWMRQDWGRLRSRAGSPGRRSLPQISTITGARAARPFFHGRTDRPLKNLRWERFCQAYVRGETAGNGQASYRAAGFRTNLRSADVSARRLLKKQSIRSRIGALQAKADAGDTAGAA